MVTTLLSLQALAVTLPFWTVFDSPLQKARTVIGIHNYITLCHIIIILCIIFILWWDLLSCTVYYSKQFTYK